MEYKIRKMTPDDNSAITIIIRDNLKKYGLDIPGTAYFDSSLNNLCAFYSSSKKRIFKNRTAKRSNTQHHEQLLL